MYGIIFLLTSIKCLNNNYKKINSHQQINKTITWQESYVSVT